MKLSTNFLKDYVDITVDAKTLAEDMTKVGNEYEEVKKLLPATNLTIGKVLECENHPDSDHLHVCKVDIGSEILNIVCGAPNVRKGLKVIVALPGAELPGGITIKKGTIRGQESNGMLCSLEELGLEHKFLPEVDKTGIHELPEDAIIGEEPIKYMGLDDEVIDFELTANRGDLLSILGMAYEVAAIYGKEVKPIDLKYNEEDEKIDDSFSVDVKTENCTIFLAKKIKNVKIMESPDFIKNRLIASGIRPINNVVDISNYVMLEVGQPLHFYDLDKLGNHIVVRMAKDEEKLITLDGVERNLTSSDIVIANDMEAVGLAGVMGGLDTEIDENTKNILIEAAIFEPTKIRQTAKKILRSEASTRYEKGLDSNRTYMAVDRACKLLQDYADAKIVSGIVKYDTTDKEDTKIDITFTNINNLLGMKLSNNEILTVFDKLGFTYVVNENNIQVSVPKRRIDISIKEDLVEEVGRIHGVDNLIGKVPKLSGRPGHLDNKIRAIRNKMISLGLNETLTYILINDKEVKNYTLDEFEEVRLQSPMSEDKNTLRYSMIPSMVKIYEYNNARNNSDISIFEIGKGFYKKQGEYGEELKLSVLMSGTYFKGVGITEKVNFYTIKGIAEEILDYLGYEGRYSFVNNEFAKESHPGQTAEISVNGDSVGIVGKVHPNILKDVYVMEINLSKLLEKRVGKMKYKEFSKFPGIKKDLAIVVDTNITSKNVEEVIKKAGGALLTKIEIFDIYKGANIGENKKSLAYSLNFEDKTKTLTDEEINKAIENIVCELEKKIGATLRK